MTPEYAETFRRLAARATAIAHFNAPIRRGETKDQARESVLEYVEKLKPKAKAKK